MFFLGSNITCFTFYIHLWPIYWLSIIWTRKKRIFCTVSKCGWLRYDYS
jgi:hypothetical protein